GPRDEAIHKKQLRKTSHTIYPRSTRCRANGLGVFISCCFSSRQDREAQFTPKGLLSVARALEAAASSSRGTEQDHRFIKKRIGGSLWFRSAEGALRTIDGYEAMHLIRKWRIRWLPQGDVVGQRRFIHTLFGIAA